jgi:antirestriction protein ArdC
MATTQDAMGLLKKGIADLTNSEAWKRYLECQAQFHTYSFGNVLMILAQKPDAKRIAGYKTWQKLGRQVRKGEKGIRIFAPVVVKCEEGEDDEATTAVRFRTVAVFDISQTDGDELPTICVEIEGDADVYDALVKAAATLGASSVRLDDCPCNGSFLPATKEIVINRNLSPNQKAKTLVHEIAHMVLGHVDNEQRNAQELEAESVAFIVMNRFGVDSGGYSFGYVASWAGDNVAEQIKAHGHRIQDAAKRVIESVA